MSAATRTWADYCRELFFPQDAHRRLWQIAYFAALAIPPMLVSHRTAADVLCGLIGFLFLLHSHSTRQWGWLRDPIMMVLFAAWGWMMFIVTPLAYNIPASASIAFPWIRFILFFAGMRFWVLREAQPIKFIGVSLAVLLLLIVVDTIWQYVYGISLSNNVTAETGRLTGPFGNVKVGIYLARMLLPALAICLFFAMKETRAKLAVFTYGVFYFFVLYTIAVSGERAPFGTTVMGTLTLLLMLMITEKKIRRICLGLIAGLLGAVYFLIMTQQWVYNRIMDVFQLLISFRYTSYGELYWSSFELGKDHPITGIGMKNFRDLCLGFLERGAVSHCNLHPHNPYLEWFSEAGSVGLAFFILFVLLLVWHCFKALLNSSGHTRLLPAFALGTLVVLLTPPIPTQSFFANWPAILFWYSLSVAISSLALCEQDKAATSRRNPSI